MSFGRLLAAGKSWVGGDGIGRYRMQKHIRLPKFISPQNPFKAAVPVEAPVIPVEIPAVNAAVARVTTPENQVSWWARVEAGVSRFALFCLDHNPFSQIGRAKLPTIPRFGSSVIQGELSLDKVKVVRSDLAHSDLEVVPVGSSGNQQMAGPAWKNLATRVLGAGLK